MQIYLFVKQELLLIQVLFQVLGQQLGCAANGTINIKLGPPEHETVDNGIWVIVNINHVGKTRFNCVSPNVNTSDYFAINYGIIYCNCNYYRELTKGLIEYNAWILVLDQDIPYSLLYGNVLTKVILI